MTNTPDEPVQPTAPASQESGLWILVKLVTFLFAIPMALIYAIKQLLG